MNDDELELEFKEDMDLSVTQVNITTEYGKAHFFVPTSYSEEEFDIHVEGVFKGIAVGFEMLTGNSAVVIPFRQDEESE